MSRKVIYHFAIFVVVNRILITKNHRILVFNNFLLKYCQLYRKIARDKNCLFSSRRALNKIFFWIFYQLLNTAISYWQLFLSTWENAVLTNSEKILWILWKENKRFLHLLFFCTVYMSVKLALLPQKIKISN